MSMNSLDVKFKKLVPWAKVPEYETRGAVGCDISVGIQEEVILYPGQITALPTGFAIKVPMGYEAQIRSRSGMAKKGLVVANAPGTVDSEHVGEVEILMINISDKPVKVLPGQKVAQMVFAPVVKAVFSE